MTSGMLKEFGPERVRDTPIAEAGIVGAGIGSAIIGMRPIVEIMFSDFITVCFDQIVNQMAKIHYMFGGKTCVPLVLRLPYGGGTGAAAQHSQSPIAWLANVPGLKIVAPSTPYDAKGLMTAAISDNSPVVFFEQKLIYGTKGEVPDGDYTVEIGKANVIHEGTDMTIISYGRMVRLALEAAEKVAQEGIKVEVLDLRTIVPLDKQAIIDAAKKTGRVLVVDEAPQTGSFAGEIIATITESEAFYTLDAPVERLCGVDSPIPYCIEMEMSAMPDTDKIIAAIRKVMR